MPGPVLGYRVIIQGKDLGSGVKTTNQFHGTYKTAWGINILQAKKNFNQTFRHQATHTIRKQVTGRK